MNKITRIFGTSGAFAAALTAVAVSGVLPGFAAGRQGSDGSTGGFRYTFTQTSNGTVVAGQDSESLAPPIFAQFPSGYAEPAAAADPHTGEADFSRDEAARRMDIVANAIVAQLFAKDTVNPETYGVRPAFEVDGHTVTLNDLDQLEFRFIPAATSYTSAVGTSGGFARPTDAWIATWQRKGVTTPGQPTSDLRIVIVMEDGTGAIHSVQAGYPEESN